MNLGTLPIDLPRLIETRMLLVAASGLGKSWALRRLIEQTATGVQQLIIDPDGEFPSLRERFDFIVCAPSGADAVATPATAAPLARALWESGASAVLDIYELRAHERVLFVKRFFDALIGAPRKLWHNTMVVLDEAHLFAPQVGSAESLSAVVDMASRGRKRGLGLVVATQRVSKLHKDVAAECLNKAIGGAVLDVDIQRAADDLGMTRAAATEALRSMEPGEFFIYGPALSRTVVRTKVGPVITTHPKVGERGLSTPPPASASILAKLAKLEGIQREAEAEQRTVDDLRAEVATLKRKLTLAEKAQGHGYSEANVAAEVERRVSEALAKQPTPIWQLPGTVQAIGKAIAALEGLRDLQLGPEYMPPRTAPTPRRVISGPPLPKIPTPEPATARAVREGMSGAEQRVIDGIAWWSAAGVDAPSRHQVAFVAGYTVNGHFNNVCGTLRSRGLADYPGGGALSITPAGAALANAPTAKPTRDELVQRIAAVLKGEPQRRLFAALVEAGEPLPREELARRCGYTVNGHFNNLCGALNGIGVAEYPGKGTVGLSAVIRDVQ